MAGRLTARTAADQEMHRHIHAAVASVRKALQAASGQTKDQDPVVMRRARSIIGQLRGAMRGLEGIGNSQPNWDRTDPDLLPEAGKVAPPRVQAPPQPVFDSDEGDN